MSVRYFMESRSVTFFQKCRICGTAWPYTLLCIVTCIIGKHLLTEKNERVKYSVKCLDSITDKLHCLLVLYFCPVGSLLYFTTLFFSRVTIYELGYCQH